MAVIKTEISLNCLVKSVRGVQTFSTRRRADSSFTELHERARERGKKEKERREAPVEQTAVSPSSAPHLRVCLLRLFLFLSII